VRRRKRDSAGQRGSWHSLNLRWLLVAG
jgi:hypothetical protein